MTEAVVNAFQVIEIQEEQGKGLVRAVGAADFAFQALEEFPIIGEPRQAIMTGTEEYLCPLSFFVP